MKPNILYLPLWKISYTVLTSGGIKYTSLHCFPQACTVTKTCPRFPIWTPSRQQYLACLSLPGISSFWRQLRCCSVILLINYRLFFSSGFTSWVGIKKLFFFFLKLPRSIRATNSCPSLAWALLRKDGLSSPKPQQTHNKVTSNPCKIHLNPLHSKARLLRGTAMQGQEVQAEEDHGAGGKPCRAQGSFTQR